MKQFNIQHKLIDQYITIVNKAIYPDEITDDILEELAKTIPLEENLEVFYDTVEMFVYDFIDSKIEEELEKLNYNRSESNSITKDLIEERLMNTYSSTLQIQGLVMSTLNIPDNIIPKNRIEKLAIDEWIYQALQQNTIVLL